LHRLPYWIPAQSRGMRYTCARKGGFAARICHDISASSGSASLARPQQDAAGLITHAASEIILASPPPPRSAARLVFAWVNIALRSRIEESSRSCVQLEASFRRVPSFFRALSRARLLIPRQFRAAEENTIVRGQKSGRRRGTGGEVKAGGRRQRRTNSKQRLVGVCTRCRVNPCGLDVFRRARYPVAP